MPTPKISLLPDKLDLALYAGDGASIQLTVTDLDGEPVPITGDYTAQIRKARLDTDSLADFNIDWVDEALGVINISLTGVQTAALITDEEMFKGVWDVQWHPENAEPITLLQGKVECDADVTR